MRLLEKLIPLRYEFLKGAFKIGVLVVSDHTELTLDIDELGGCYSW